MAEVTLSSMHDARDAEDTRLLAAGEYNALLRSYYESIIQRCRVRCRTEDDALDCAQAVAVRLLSELKRGRRYGVPYRVVVHKVIEWTTRGFYQRGRAALVEIDDDLPEEVFRPGNPYQDVETRYDLERAIAELPKGDREVARLRLVEGTRSSRSPRSSARSETQSTRLSTAPASDSRSSSREHCRRRLVRRVRGKLGARRAPGCAGLPR